MSYVEPSRHQSWSPPDNRYCIDAEFYEDGHVIHPISLALAGDDGNDLYIEFDFDWDLVPADHWIQDNVRPHLWDQGQSRRDPGMLWVRDGAQGGGSHTTHAAREEILRFVGPQPTFYGWYSAYDWVMLAQLFGPMAALPDGFPMLCIDLKPYVPADRILPTPRDLGFQAHHALGDARWTRWLAEKLLWPGAAR